MRRAMLFILLVWSLGLAAQAADTLDFPLPQLMNPMFDAFSRNYVSTAALGRGYTGVALSGGLDNVLLNPAGYALDRATVHLEGLVKPPIEATLWRLTDPSTGALLPNPDRMGTRAPSGIVGVGGSLAPNFTGAILYSLPKTIRIDDFSVEMNFGSYLLTRYPTFNLHQLTLNTAWHHGDFHIGLNLHNQIYFLGDVPFLRTFERINNNTYFLRPQLGALYEGDKFNAGVSFIPASEAKWDLKYAQYDTVLPLQLSLGAAFKPGNARLTGEVEYENTRALSELFSDRYTIRLGAEIDVRRFTYRIGYAYVPEVWHGFYHLPINTTAQADTSLWWNDVIRDTRFYIEPNTQHLLTIGSTWRHKDVRVNLGGLIDLGGEVPVAEISMGIDLYFSAFKKQGFLFFE